MALDKPPGCRIDSVSRHGRRDTRLEPRTATLSSIPSSEQITQAIAQAATEPKRVTADGISTEMHDVDQLVKAAEHVAANTAKGPTRGFTFGRIVNGGAA
jgi:hypothetical protein